MVPPLRSLTLLACVSLAWVGCSPSGGSGKGASGGAAAAPAREAIDGGKFRMAEVELRRIERALQVTGSLLPMDQTPVAVKVPGRLERMGVDLGSYVKEGAILAQVEGADYELRVKQAEAALAQARARVGLSLEGDNDQVRVEDSPAVKEARAVLDEARANRERIAALSGQGILSASELESANATFKVATSRHDEALEEARIRVAQLQQRRAELEIARKELADTFLRAPFDGAVQERRANIGEYLAVGAPVVVIVRVDPLRLRVEVPERESVRVRAGQVVRVSVDGDTNVYSGEVRRLSPAIVQGSRTLVVEADVPTRGQLRPGAFARAQIVTLPEARALTVPSEALISFAGIEKVFVMEDGQSVEKRVSTGDRGAGWVEVISGVRQGDLVVLTPGGLQAGQRIQRLQGTDEPTAASKPVGVSPGS